ncbi:MAG: hypothetical protein AB9869_22985 [Verrucomicrobiia bacterium]
MHTPVGPRTALLFDGGGIHNSDSTLRAHSLHDLLLTNFGHSRGKTPQPRLTGSEPLEQSNIGNVGNGLLTSAYNGLA